MLTLCWDRLRSKSAWEPLLVDEYIEACIWATNLGQLDPKMTQLRPNLGQFSPTWQDFELILEAILASKNQQKTWFILKAQSPWHVYRATKGKLFLRLRGYRKSFKIFQESTHKKHYDDEQLIEEPQNFSKIRSWAHLGPTWSQFGATWPQVGPPSPAKLAQLGPKLGPR